MTMVDHLSLYRPVSVLFSDTELRGCSLSDDGIATVISETAKKGRRITIDCRRDRFSAGSYFACLRDIHKRKIIDVYVEKERALPERRAAKKFLRVVARNPLRSKYIHFLPGVHPGAHVIVLVVNAANANRIIGLSAYLRNFSVDIIPAAPTSAVLFRPLILKNSIHLNLIDYFDRDHQAVGSFNDGEMLIGCSPSLFKQLGSAFLHSAYGAFQPRDLNGL